MTVLEAESQERFTSDIRANVDPTTNPPEFAFTTGDARPSSWDDGEWVGDALGSGSNWLAVALTPLLGATGSGATVELAAGELVPWVRITLGDEQVVRRLASLLVDS